MSYDTEIPKGNYEVDTVANPGYDVDTVANPNHDVDT